MVGSSLNSVAGSDHRHVRPQSTLKEQQSSVCGYDASFQRGGASFCCHLLKSWLCRLESSSLPRRELKRTTFAEPWALPWPPDRQCLRLNCADPLIRTSRPDDGCARVEKVSITSHQPSVNCPIHPLHNVRLCVLRCDVPAVLHPCQTSLG